MAITHLLQLSRHYIIIKIFMTNNFPFKVQHGLVFLKKLDVELKIETRENDIY